MSPICRHAPSLVCPLKCRPISWAIMWGNNYIRLLLLPRPLLPQPQKRKMSSDPIKSECVHDDGNHDHDHDNEDWNVRTPTFVFWKFYYIF
mmetsp:Transcript_22862/g.25519  ORF Transcript_22862/g.25519 Transcript_22862/m.25519 type:complete len:91 (+) Transcript_22862:200-472(+)